MKLAEDIYLKIKNDFNSNEIEAVEKVLLEAINTGLNVDANQYARSAIFLANKDLDLLKTILLDYDDPRDLLMEAEDESGNLDHWFAIPFPEIEKLKGKKYSGETFEDDETSEGDDLPF